MKEQLINFSTAKLAKKKGFNWKTMYHYCGRKVISGGGYETSENSYRHTTLIDAPTQSFLQKWLREERDITIEISFDTITFGYRIFNPFKSSDYFSKWIFKTFTYEEALEEGLLAGLKLI